MDSYVLSICHPLRNYAHLSTLLMRVFSHLSTKEVTSTCCMVQISLYGDNCRSWGVFIRGPFSSSFTWNWDTKLWHFTLNSVWVLYVEKCKSVQHFCIAPLWDTFWVSFSVFFYFFKWVGLGLHNIRYYIVIEKWDKISSYILKYWHVVIWN